MILGGVTLATACQNLAVGKFHDMILCWLDWQKLQPVFALAPCRNLNSASVSYF